MTVTYDPPGFGVRLHPPQVVYYPLLVSSVCGISETDLIKGPQVLRLVFNPESFPDVHFPDNETYVLNVPWRWVCEDCHYACGDTRDIFKTDWAAREALGNFGETPTSTQTEQMAQHAKQHSIMLSWAKGLK